MATRSTLLPAVVLTVALLPACGGSSSGSIAVNPPGPTGAPGIGDGAGPPPAPADPADPAEPAEPADPTIDEPSEPEPPADPEIPADPDGP